MAQHAPKQAFILAAGFGTRMLPLTRSTPKPLMPIWGKPAIQHGLEMLKRWGVKKVLINLHHQPEMISAFVKSHNGFGLDIDFSYEPKILGTGGALRKAEKWIGKNPFWLINADVVADLDPAPLLSAFRQRRVLAALWMNAEKGPRTVEMKNGFISTFQSSTPGSDNTYTFCGLHLVSPRVLEFIPKKGFSSIITAYQRAMRKGKRIAGTTINDTYWADIGTPQQYLDTHHEIMIRGRQRTAGARLFDSTFRRRTGKGIRVTGFAAVGPSAHIAPGATLQRSVIWPDAKIKRNAHIVDAVIADNTNVSGQTTYMAARADRILDHAARQALEAYGWDTERVTAYPFPPRGSARTFIRVEKNSKRLILIRYTLKRKENGLYFSHARLLKNIGVRVPTTAYLNKKTHTALIEDLGSKTLTEEIHEMPEKQKRKLYQRILDQVIILHTRGTRAVQRRNIRLMPPFSDRLYRWERNFFAEQFLCTYAHADKTVISRITRELAGIARQLKREPLVLIHRDLQSSNILLVRHVPAFIDFQGMRLGSAAYDVASLLCDPYVSLSETMQEDLLHYYNQHIERKFAVSREIFWIAAIERLAQALGAYVRLSKLRGMESFALHIPPALMMMRRVTGNTTASPGLQSLIQQV